MKIDVLKASEIDVDSFLYKNEKSLIYYSKNYLKLLQVFLKEQPYIITAKDGNELVGMLPYMIKRSGKLGNVINSSPFYGSNGGVLTQEFDSVIYKLLLDKFDEIALENNCITSTFITSPFEKANDWLDTNYKFDCKDYRIGQITFLPDKSEMVMDVLHTKTRNTVRKAMKTITRIEYENGLNYLDFIFETHKENLSAINGIYKPKDFFNKIVDTFSYGDQLRIYIGFDEFNNPITGLLNLYFNKTIEYFCPVTVSKYRELQPLSGLIYNAMQDGVQDKFKFWNWGGTWATQGGVYNFKSRWGTSDLNYYYYTKIYDKNITQIQSTELLQEFPYFFVLPFSKLING
jgi:hypothetical protein